MGFLMRIARGSVVSAVVAVVGSLYANAASGSFDVICIADPNGKPIAGRHACLHEPQSLSFGESVTLAVQSTTAFENDTDDEGEEPPDPSKLVLFFDGTPLIGSRAHVGTQETDDKEVTTTLVTFFIRRDLSSESARKTWKEIIAKAHSGHAFRISAGLPDGQPAESDVEIEFVPVRGNRLLLWALLAGAGAVAFFAIAARTGALRDKEPAGPGIEKPTDRSYSLSRVQISLWTLLVVYAYLFIWCLTCDYNVDIPKSIVGLMGISLGTFGTAAAIDANKVKTERTTVSRSDGFVQDLTTDVCGASLHRLQLVVWTLAVAVVFAVTVWEALAMPDLSPTILGLIGISSGTYVGLKLPERKS
ncbi:MAG TPA: hypothetical protein VFV19_18840 [Candidatus Polarisedimenticolaceae bacterium]|nr:hypothetical protein [Candidatus Polarisedimenticolaceae bacterium]